MWMRVWVSKAWKVKTMVLPAFTHFYWPHLFHKQLNNEEESLSVWRGGRTGLFAQEGGDIQHIPYLVAPLELEGRVASEESCFLLTCRWQHGPAVRDQLSSYTPLLLLWDSELFSGH